MNDNVSAKWGQLKLSRKPPNWQGLLDAVALNKDEAPLIERPAQRTLASAATLMMAGRNELERVA